MVEEVNEQNRLKASYDNEPIIMGPTELKLSHE